jgi:RNA polymerase sigma-70 factor, ECF subfamily
LQGFAKIAVLYCERAKKMKEKILEEMMMSEGKKVFNMILRMVRDRQDSEDLFQEVFSSFYKSLDRINPEARRSYLFRIAYNKTLNKIKKKKRQQFFSNSILKQPSIAPEPDNDQRNALIRESLAKLDPTEALLIDLQFFQNKSYREISEISGFSISAVDTRLVRAKKKLREILEKEGIKNLQDNQLSAV